MTPIIVFVSKFYQVSVMFLEFTRLMYPQLQIETAYNYDSIKHKNAYMIVGIAEESQCDTLITRFPKNLRVVSRNSILMDFTRIMDDEGIQKQSRGL